MDKLIESIPHCTQSYSFVNSFAKSFSCFLLGDNRGLSQTLFNFVDSYFIYFLIKYWKANLILPVKCVLCLLVVGLYYHGYAISFIRNKGCELYWNFQPPIFVFLRGHFSQESWLFSCLTCNNNYYLVLTLILFVLWKDANASSSAPDNF